MIIGSRAVLVGIAAAGITALTACGGSTSGHGNSASSGVSPKVAARSSSPPSLAGKVLQLSDLPTGWVVDNSPGGNSTMSGCTGGNSKNATVEKDVQYAATGGIPQLSESLGYFGTPGQATTEYRSGIAELNQCTHFTMADGGAKYTMTLGAMSFPHVGDQSGAYLARTTIKSVPVSFALVAVRKAGYIALIEYGSVGSADTAQLQALVTKAVNRIG